MPVLASTLRPRRGEAAGRRAGVPHAALGGRPPAGAGELCPRGHLDRASRWSHGGCGAALWAWLISGGSWS